MKSVGAPLVLVLTLALLGCVEPPPYPKILPRADADSETGAEPDSAADTSATPACGTAADCALPGPCEAAATCEPHLGCVYPPLSCDDFIACTKDFCLPDVGCVNDVGDCCRSDAECDDGDPCTAPATCQGLACVGGAPVDCSSLDAPCYLGTCSAVDGTCSAVALVDGTPCDDGSEGTSEDACDAAECVGVPNGCNDKNPCTIDSLEAATGKCLHEPLPDLTLCDDADPCTIADTCNGGLCLAVPRAEPQVVWQVKFDPAPSDSFVPSGATKAGGAVALAPFRPSAIVYHAGGALPISDSVTFPDGTKHGAFGVFRINKLGVIDAYERVSGSGDAYLEGSAFSPDGDAFLLLKRDGSLFVPGPAPVLVEEPAEGAIHTLLYLPHAGGFGWALDFPVGLAPTAPFVLATSPPRIGVLATHAGDSAQPTLGGGSGPTLGAPSVGTMAVSMLTWGLDGSADTAATIGWLGQGAETSKILTRAANDATVAVLLQAEGPALLGATPGALVEATGGQAVLLGAFNASGSALTTLEIVGPFGTQADLMGYTSDFGLVVPLDFRGTISITQAGAAPGLLAGPVNGDYVQALLGRSVAGTSLWPLLVSPYDPGLRSAASQGDGTLYLAGYAKGFSAPCGGDYGFLPPGQPEWVRSRVTVHRDCHPACRRRDPALPSGRQEEGRRHAAACGGDGLLQPVEEVDATPSRGFDDGEDAARELCSLRAVAAEAQLAPDDPVPERSLGVVVRGFNALDLQERPQRVPLPQQVPAECSCLFVTPARGPLGQHAPPRSERLRVAPELTSRNFAALKAVPQPENAVARLEQPLADGTPVPAPVDERLEIAPQMSVAKLTSLDRVEFVRAPAVAVDDAAVVRRKQVAEGLAASVGIDVKVGRVGRCDHPQPPLPTSERPARLIGMNGRRAVHLRSDLLHRGRDRRAHPIEHVLYGAGRCVQAVQRGESDARIAAAHPKATRQDADDRVHVWPEGALRDALNVGDFIDDTAPRAAARHELVLRRVKHRSRDLRDLIRARDPQLRIVRHREPTASAAHRRDHHELIDLLRRHSRPRRPLMPRLAAPLTRALRLRRRLLHMRLLPRRIRRRRPRRIGRVPAQPRLQLGNRSRQRLDLLAEQPDGLIASSELQFQAGHPGRQLLLARCRFVAHRKCRS